MTGKDPTSYAILDVETTIFQKGNPYADRNSLCYVGCRIGGTNHLVPVVYGGQPYREQLEAVRDRLRSVSDIVGFNLKFDLAWLARYGIDLSDKRIWDCQLCEFLERNQSEPYPSLGEALSRRGLPPKSDYIEKTYWDIGIDTPDIPSGELEEYLTNDLEITEALYLDQNRTLPESKRALFRLGCEDLKVLLEMERNGLLFDFEAMAQERQRLADSLAACDVELAKYTDNWPHFNPDSGDHLSCLLYGGTVSVDIAIPYEHTYKTGKKAGVTEIRNRWETITKTYPRLVEPIPRTELKKAGFWSTDESVLRKTRGQKKLVKLLLQRSKIEKLIGTYFDGIPAHLVKYDWQDGLIHGTFNQCVAVTGRLSSEKPNQQNFPEEISGYIASRF